MSEAVFTVSGYTFSLVAALSLLTALGTIFLALAVLILERRTPESAYLFFFTLTAAIWLGGFGIAYAAPDADVALRWVRASYLGITFLPAALYRFTVEVLGIEDRRRVAAALMLGVSALISVLIVGGGLLVPGVIRYPWGWMPRLEGPSLLLTAYVVGGLVAALLEYGAAYRRLPDGERRRRVLWFLVAFGIGSLAAVDYLPSYGVEVPPVGFVGVLVGLSVLAWTVRRYELVDFTPAFASDKILATMSDAVIGWDRERRIRLVNRAVNDVLGYLPEELTGARLETLAPPGRDERDRFRSTVGAGGEAPVHSREMQLADAGGSPVPVSVSLSTLQDRDGRDIGRVLIARDLREQRRTHRALERRDAVLGAISFAAEQFLRSGEWTEGMEEVLARLGVAAGMDRVHIFKNEEGPDDPAAAARRYGWAADGSGPGGAAPEELRYVESGFRRWREVLGAGGIVHGPVGDLPPGERRALEARGVRSVVVVPIFVGERWWGFMELDDTSGGEDFSRAVLDALKAAADTLGTAIHRHDTRLELKRSQQEMTRLALYDTLTGLPNRNLFRDRLEHALERADRRGERVALLFLDLDRFKVVNDTLGHAAGDQLLSAVAQRILGRFRREDTVARLGGDEFAALLEDVSGVEEATAAASRLARAFEAPFEILDTEVHLEASTGVALSGEDDLRPDDLLRFADVAMYQAKQEGGDWHVFDPGSDAGATRRLHRENALREAVREERLEIHYQPSVDLESGEILGVEALARMRGPEGELLAPREFVGLAEETGLIVPLGGRVLERACRRAAGWSRRRPEEEFRLSVNLSARQFQEAELTDRVRRALDESGLPADRLQLEITESVLMQGIERAERLLGLGVRLAIDDFGTGYSSFEYLRHLRADVLKIDRSFVANLASDPRDAVIVETILGVGRKLGLEVVAEGVETEDQRDRLLELGCRRGQGFLFSPPLPPEELERRLPPPDDAAVPG